MKLKKPFKDRINNRVFGLIIYLVLIAIVSAFLLSLVNDKNKNILGYSPRLVVTGSMEPVIRTNSINIIKICNIEDIKENDIICFNYGQDIVHRVIEITTSESGDILLHTKGDANDNPDGVEITDDMLIGKVVYTFNGIANLLDKYSDLPGHIDEGALIRELMVIGISIGIIVFFVSWVVSLIIIIIKSFRKKDDFQDDINKYLADIDELIMYRELVYNIKDYETDNKAETRLQFLLNRIAQARAEMEINSLHNEIKEFKRAINHCNYLTRLGLMLDSKEIEDKKSLSSVIEYCKNITGDIADATDELSDDEFFEEPDIKLIDVQEIKHKPQYNNRKHKKRKRGRR